LFLIQEQNIPITKIWEFELRISILPFLSISYEANGLLRIENLNYSEWVSELIIPIPVTVK